MILILGGLSGLLAVYIVRNWLVPDKSETIKMVLSILLGLLFAVLGTTGLDLFLN